MRDERCFSSSSHLHLFFLFSYPSTLILSLSSILIFLILSPSHFILICDLRLWLITDIFCRRASRFGLIDCFLILNLFIIFPAIGLGC